MPPVCCSQVRKQLKEVAEHALILAQQHHDVVSGRVAHDPTAWPEAVHDPMAGASPPHVAELLSTVEQR